MKIRFIGDVHGQWKQDYFPKLEGCDRSVQVGDMGVGFLYRINPEDPYGVRLPSPPPSLGDFPGKHEYIRGNHDNPLVCRQDPNCIPDGTYRDGVFYVGGGLSIDREYRTEGIDWWRDEELSYAEFEKIIDVYRQLRPAIVVTHECPDEVAGAMMAALNRIKFNDFSRTRQAFQRMLEIHQPKIWIFGHWHVSMNFKYGPTNFVCLGIGETIDIETDDFLV